MMLRVPDRKESTYRCQVCGMECVKKKMEQSSDPVTKTGDYGDNATPTPTAYSDTVYTATTVSFTAASGDDPAYLSDSALLFADKHISSGWNISIETIGTNLLTDGGFNNWTSGVLDSWSNARCSYQEVGDNFGSCVKVTATGADGIVYQAGITVTAEASYTLRGDYRNASGSLAIYRLYDVSNSAVIDAGATSTEHHRLSDSEAWKAFSYDFDAPSGCTEVQVSIGAEDSGEIAYFDRLSVATSGTNDGSYTIASRGVSRGTVLLSSTDSLTTESAATAGTVTIKRVIYKPNITTGCPFCGSLNSNG